MKKIAVSYVETYYLPGEDYLLFVVDLEDGEVIAHFPVGDDEEEYGPALEWAKSHPEYLYLEDAPWRMGEFLWDVILTEARASARAKGILLEDQGD